ncbi:MAG TPA: hypothetical protein VFU93_05760, partial [Acidimicrobiales bacterium]|nr:hypothetical protein [Acidimicrobiales bacterium]
MRHQAAGSRKSRRRASAAILLAVALPLLTPSRADAHAGDGSPEAVHICVDADGIYHLAGD